MRCRGARGTVCYTPTHACAPTLPSLQHASGCRGRAPHGLLPGLRNGSPAGEGTGLGTRKVQERRFRSCPSRGRRSPDPVSMRAMRSAVSSSQPGRRQAKSMSELRHRDRGPDTGPDRCPASKRAGGEIPRVEEPSAVVRLAAGRAGSVGDGLGVVVVVGAVGGRGLVERGLGARWHGEQGVGPASSAPSSRRARDRRSPRGLARVHRRPRRGRPRAP